MSVLFRDVYKDVYFGWGEIAVREGSILIFCLFFPPTPSPPLALACLRLFNNAAVGLCQVSGCRGAGRSLVGCTLSGCRIGPVLIDWNFL